MHKETGEKKLASCRNQACSSGKLCMVNSVRELQGLRFVSFFLKFQTSAMALELENRGEMKLALQYVPHPVGGMHCCFAWACQTFGVFVLSFFFF